MLGCIANKAAAYSTMNLAEREKVALRHICDRTSTGRLRRPTMLEEGAAYVCRAVFGTMESSRKQTDAGSQKILRRCNMTHDG